MTIHIKLSINKQFYWALVGRNGKTLATSETYKSHQNVMKTAKLVSNGIIPIKDHVKL